MRAFSSCGKRGPLFITVCGPFTVTASLVVGHRLQTRRLSNCGSWAQLLCGMWDLPRPGLEPVSPALAGRFSTTVLPGKPFNFLKEDVLASWPSAPVHASGVPTMPGCCRGCEGIPILQAVLLGEMQPRLRLRCVGLPSSGSSLQQASPGSPSLFPQCQGLVVPFQTLTPPSLVSGQYCYFQDVPYQLLPPVVPDFLFHQHPIIAPSLFNRSICPC